MIQKGKRALAFFLVYAATKGEAIEAIPSTVQFYIRDIQPDYSITNALDQIDADDSKKR